MHICRETIYTCRCIYIHIIYIICTWIQREVGGYSIPRLFAVTVFPSTSPECYPQVSTITIRAVVVIRKRRQIGWLLKWVHTYVRLTPWSGLVRLASGDTAPLRRGLVAERLSSNYPAPPYTGILCFWVYFTFSIFFSSSWFFHPLFGSSRGCQGRGGGAQRTVVRSVRVGWDLISSFDQTSLKAHRWACEC